MPAKPKKAPWEEIKQAYMLGESTTTLAVRFNIKPGTIRSRASREGWITPRNMDEKIDERLAEINDAEQKGAMTSKEAKERRQKIKEFQSTLGERQQAHRAEVDSIISKKIKEQKLPPIKTWKDMEIADRIQRKNLELDKDTPDAIINVGVLGSGVVVETSATKPKEPEAFDMDALEERVANEGKPVPEDDNEDT